MTNLSADQANALDHIADWHRRLDVKITHCDGDGDTYDGDEGIYVSCPKYPHTHGTGPAPIMSLGGWAGTGKTTLMKALEAELGIKAVFGTPTHKAASVLRKKLDRHQATRVRTYHSLIYHMRAVYHCEQTGKKVRRIVDNCTCRQPDACECPARFDPCQAPITHDCRVREELNPERRRYIGGHREIVIIDESSMLSPEQVEDIRYFGVPVILVGDHGQLPPVKAEMNPWTLRPDVELTQIHRQGADSGILQAAHDVRRHGRMRQLRYGAGDAVRMPLSDQEVRGVFERFTPGPDKVIVTSTNSLRADFNAAFHGQGPVRPGDRVVALGGMTYDAPRSFKTGDTYQEVAEYLPVHNGMTGTVREVTDHGGPTIGMVVELDDHILATPGNPVCLFIGGVVRAQFGARTDLPFNSRDRPKGSRLWDYAYALTAHKAQGSEFDKVIVADTGAPSYAQWLYTSITRAKEGVLVLDYQR